MGAKTWMIVYADRDVRATLKARPALERLQSKKLAQRLFPKEALEELSDGTLSYTCPPDDEICVGCFPGVSIVAAKEFGIDYPSKLPLEFRKPAGKGTLYLHAMHSVVDWLAFAIWKDGVLVRSLSLSPDSGILEDSGAHMSFEAPYWSGQQPAVVDDEEDGYPFPFHPLELGEAALDEFFGYCIEGRIDSEMVEPDSIPLMRFKRKRRSRWKFWK